MASERAADPRSAAPLRPISRESNISKRRVDSSRLSFPFHGDETADLEKFGSAWNHYLQNHARRSENAAARMAGLENKLAEQTKSLKEYTHKCSHQSAAITGLEKQVSELSVQKRELTKEHQIAKQHLERNEARREEMQAKLRSYREKLNEAIVEQQDLYMRSKSMCDSAINDVRKTQEEAEEAQRVATEMLEEGMNRAAAARRETKALLEGELKKCRLLQATVEKENVGLRQQLSEAQNELKCDKAKIEDLLSQLERERPTRDHLQTLESKSNEILLQLQQASSLLPANEETHQTMLSKLDVVLERVQASALNTREYANLKETLNGLVSQLDSTSSQLLADVRSVLTSQSSIVAMSGGLEKTIKDQLSSVNRLIKEQEEGLLNKLQATDGKCQELTIRLAEKNSELSIAAANVQQMSRMADEKSQRVEQLHVQVQELQEISHERNHLKLENKALLEQLSNKDSDNAALQMQFEDALSQNQIRALELQNFTRQIADRLQEKGADADDVSALRTKMACKLEVERSKLDEAKRVLQRCQEEKSKLGKDFIDITAEKSKLSKELEELRAQRSEEASSLERTRVSLIQAEQRVVNLREKLKTSEFKTRDIQNVLAQWAGKKMDGAEIQEDILDLDLDAMRILVRTIMGAHRESEAAKDCLRAVLEMPSSAVAEDTSRVAKPGCSPVGDQEGGAANAEASIDAGIAPGTAEGVYLGIPSIDQSDQGGTTERSDFPLDTSRDSVRRIIVQSPFDEENSHYVYASKREQLRVEPRPSCRSPGKRRCTSCRTSTKVFAADLPNPSKQHGR
ncbi:uncharacterized protein DNG_07552 [Cephalotrichum gorgonifer]|uniref:Uncharacterized protein n=1 Tax=Cephalotrichum gorgonifer TaxID=2041049 RepID=A0AAE8N2L7_9PEZI|nr:uncharacterized protein DNG_07552 [Cephalotrichum gorgonifer]